MGQLTLQRCTASNAAARAQPSHVKEQAEQHSQQNSAGLQEGCSCCRRTPCLFLFLCVLDSIVGASYASGAACEQPQSEDKVLYFSIFQWVQQKVDTEVPAFHPLQKGVMLFILIQQTSLCLVLVSKMAVQGYGRVAATCTRQDRYRRLSFLTLVRIRMRSLVTALLILGNQFLLLCHFKKYSQKCLSKLQFLTLYAFSAYFVMQ